MSSSIDGQVAAVMTAIDSVTPEPPAFPVTGANHLPRFRPVLVATSAFFAVLAAVGVVVLIAGHGVTGPFGGGSAVDSVNLAGLLVPVRGEPVKSRGAWIYAARMANPGAIDTGNLGTEVALAPADPRSFVVPTSNNPLESNALRAREIVYLGNIAGAQMALHETEGNVCVFLGNNTDVSGGGRCLDGSDIVGGTSVDPPVGQWLVWTGLPPSAAVVTVTGSDGNPYWQRVAGGTVAFILPHGRPVDPATLKALDATGNEVASTEGMSINPFDVGLCMPTDGC